MADIRIVVVENGDAEIMRQTLAAVAGYTLGGYDLRVVAHKSEHWARSLEADTIVLEAGHLPQTPHWTDILRAQSRAGHALLSLAPSFAGQGWSAAHAQETVTTNDLARFSPGALYLPAEVTAALGGWTRYDHPVLEAADYVVRAKLLGWTWCYSLRVRHRLLVPDPLLPAGMAETTAWRLFEERCRAYEAGELDIYVPCEERV